jgi:hypothetical protein
MNMIDIYAGSNALKKIKTHGFKQDLFTNFLGASGGPKWFALLGLDKYLFGEFFKGRTTELNLVGSSAGAFRAACFAQKDPVAAITRLANKYARSTYSEKVDRHEISNSAFAMIDELFGENGIEEIIQNPIFKAHFIVAKSKGLTQFENKFLQGTGLLTSIVRNKIGRKLLRSQYERYVFRSASSNLTIEDPYQFKTEYVDLTKQNIVDSLLASGSIPYVMHGIKDIHGAPKGMYRDGGIIDYHFDVSLKEKDNNANEDVTTGLTLYPHFNSEPKAGWFDKSSSRQVSNENYKNTVLLVPSQKFIDSLPYGKIPDRTDFTNIPTDVRIKYWLKVLSETERVSDELREFVEQQDLSKIKAFKGS